MYMASPEELYSDPFLRFLAGEHWRPVGMSRNLLAALVVEQTLYQAILEEEASPLGASGRSITEYREQQQLVESLLQTVGEPPDILPSKLK
jgi:hypothetical protein